MKSGFEDWGLGAKETKTEVLGVRHTGTKGAEVRSTWRCALASWVGR